eukprot:Clim_evm65s214 gene=Clim_evmTU65s214
MSGRNNLRSSGPAMRQLTSAFPVRRDSAKGRVLKPLKQNTTASVTPAIQISSAFSDRETTDTTHRHRKRLAPSLSPRADTEHAMQRHAPEAMDTDEERDGEMNKSPTEAGDSTLNSARFINPDDLHDETDRMLERLGPKERQLLLEAEKEAAPAHGFPVPAPPNRSEVEAKEEAFWNSAEQDMSRMNLRTPENKRRRRTNDGQLTMTGMRRRQLEREHQKEYNKHQNGMESVDRQTSTRTLPIASTPTGKGSRSPAHASQCLKTPQKRITHANSGSSTRRSSHSRHSLSVGRHSNVTVCRPDGSPMRYQPVVSGRSAQRLLEQFSPKQKVKSKARTPQTHLSGSTITLTPSSNAHRAFPPRQNSVNRDPVQGSEPSLPPIPVASARVLTFDSTNTAGDSNSAVHEKQEQEHMVSRAEAILAKPAPKNRYAALLSAVEDRLGDGREGSDTAGAASTTTTEDIMATSMSTLTTVGLPRAYSRILKLFESLDVTLAHAQARNRTRHLSHLCNAVQQAARSRFSWIDGSAERAVATMLAVWPEAYTASRVWVEDRYAVGGKGGTWELRLDFEGPETAGTTTPTVTPNSTPARGAGAAVNKQNHSEQFLPVVNPMTGIVDTAVCLRRRQEMQRRLAEAARDMLGSSSIPDNMELDDKRLLVPLPAPARLPQPPATTAMTLTELLDQASGLSDYTRARMSKGLIDLSPSKKQAEIQRRKHLKEVIDGNGELNPAVTSSQQTQGAKVHTTSTHRRPLSAKPKSALERIKERQALREEKERLAREVMDQHAHDSTAQRRLKAIATSVHCILTLSGSKSMPRQELVTRIVDECTTRVSHGEVSAALSKLRSELPDWYSEKSFNGTPYSTISPSVSLANVRLQLASRAATGQ